MFFENILNIKDFQDAYSNNTEEVGVDKIDENGKIMYEIQLGVALVGGKITLANSEIWCGYILNKLGNDLDFLLNNPNFDKIQLYKYIDLEKIDEPNNFTGILNATIDKEIADDKKQTTNNNYENNRYDRDYDRFHRYGGTKKRKKIRKQKRKTHRKK